MNSIFLAFPFHFIIQLILFSLELLDYLAFDNRYFLKILMLCWVILQVMEDCILKYLLILVEDIFFFLVGCDQFFS